MEKKVVEESTKLLSQGNSVLLAILIVLASVFLLTTVILFFKLLKKNGGKLNINLKDKKIDLIVDKTEKETNRLTKDTLRDIIRKQINYANNVIQELETNYLFKFQNESQEVIWQIKYSAEKIIDNVNQWITLNHMNRGDEHYIDAKQKEVLNIIRNIVKTDEVHKEEFQNHMKDEVRNLIENLIDIRDEQEKTEQTILLEKLESIKQEIKSKK